MAKTTLKHKLEDGRVITRTTARTYTHVVLCREDLVYTWALEGRILDVDKRNFDYHQKVIALGVGGTYVYSQRVQAVISQESYDDAVKAIGNCKTRDEYAAKQADKRLKAHAERYGDAKQGEWTVAGWCGRQDLADKLHAKEVNRGDNAVVRTEAINNGERA